MRKFLRHFFVYVTIFVYSFVMLFWFFPFVNILTPTYAEQVSEKNNLVLVLVDWDIYSGLKDEISWYVDYIQQWNKNTKAIVFPIDTKLVKSTDIQKVINNLYFHWEKDNTSFLKWIVLIWNVPLPVVNKDGFIYQSVYPYVDVVKPAFRYDGKYFSYIWKPSKVELFHWIIKFDSVNDYNNYFEKLRKYANNPANFVEKKFFYWDYVSLWKSVSNSALKLYLNKLIFAQNLVYNKITPLLMNYFSNDYEQSLNNLVKEDNNSSSTKIEKFEPVNNDDVFANILGFNSEDFKKFENIQKKYTVKASKFKEKVGNLVSQATESQQNYWDIPTKQLESSLKNFFRNFLDIFWSEYISTISDNIKATWRYSWEDVISVLNTIDIKDTVSINYLKRVNIVLEDLLDKKINEKKFFMYYPVMIDYTEWDNNTNICEETYETFFFWKNVLNDINKLSDLTIYRWTYQNITSLNKLSSISSRSKKSSFSNVWIFSIQVEANRAYNSMWNTSKDAWGFWNTCSTSNWACIDMWRNSNSESVNSWAKRIFWWYSPMNINADAMWWTMQYRFPLNYSNYKYAWHPIDTPDKNGSLFDIWWSVYVDRRFETDNIFDVLKYASIWKTRYYKRSLHYGCEWHYLVWWSDKIWWKYYDYFINFSDIAFTECSDTLESSGSNFSFSWNTLYITKYRWCSEKKEQVTRYKFIDTRIKHTDPTTWTMSKLSLATWARPIDEKNYISFLGVWGDTVRLDYPDIFSVDVYKEKNWKLVLKTPNEIAQSIKNYLKQVVRDYNNKLGQQLAKKNSFYTRYQEAWDSLPTNLPNEYKLHGYSLLSENLFIKKIWEEKISKIAEMLYYLNLWWKEKTKASTLSWELNNLYNQFNVFEKVEYLTKNYIDTESKYNVNWFDISHSNINFPDKPTNWYEAWIIISKNLDDSNVDLKNRKSALNVQSLLQRKHFSVESAKKECWYTLWEAIIIFKWPAAFLCRLKETLKKPFKIWSTASCSQNSKSFLNFLNSDEALNNWSENNSSEQLSKIESYVNTYYQINTDKSIYNYWDLAGYVIISNYSSEHIVSKIKISSPSLTWNCFYFKQWSEYKNSCNEEIAYSPDSTKIPFYFYNPKTKNKYFANVAWNKILNIKFCNLNNVCYTKQIYFSKAPWELKDIEIKPLSNVMVRWWENPVVIRWYDALPSDQVYKNEIDSTYYTYDLKLDPSVWLIDEKDSITFNFSKNAFIIYANKEPLSVNKFKIIWKLSQNWWFLSGKVLPSFEKEINIVKKTNLLPNEVKIYSGNTLLTSLENISLPDNPSYFFSWDTFDKNKIWKINIKPIVKNIVLKTRVKVEDPNGHFIIWIYQNWKFVKENEFLIDSDNWVDVYAIPSHKTWPFKILVKIPWINTYEIKWSIKDFPIEELYVKLDKYQLEPNEEVNWRIFGVDKFWNLIDNLNISITKSEWIKVTLNWNKLKVKWEKTWWIKFSYTNSKWKKVSTIVYVGINKSFLPLDWKISVMYLTLLGYDWWKYASKIMRNSSKNLAITTTLVNKDTLKKFDILIDESLYSNTDTLLTYSWGNIVLNFWKIIVNTHQNPFKWKIKYSKSLGNIVSAGIYYIPEQLDDVVTSNYLADNKIVINSKPIIDFDNWNVDDNLLIASNFDLTKKYYFTVYDIVYKNKLVGKIAINWNYFDVSKFKVNLPLFTQITYGWGSSNWPKAFGISLSDERYENISSNISLNVDDNKWLWFRSNFKNISNFAAWLNVGEATKPFASEFLMNFWDPFIKKISRNPIIEPVKMAKTYGYNVYYDIAWGIKKVVPLDFNNNWEKDLVVVYSNKLRFLKNYAWENHFEDLWNLMFLPKPIDDIFAGDYNWDGYEDLYVMFEDGTIRVYKNNQWEFSVNGYLVCLDLTKSDPYKLKYSQIFFYDMNNDKKTDIVVNDIIWNIKVFYWPSYVSNSITGCNANFKDRLKWQLVKSYVIKVDNKKFADAGYIFWEWMKSNSTLMQDEFKKEGIKALIQDESDGSNNFLEWKISDDPLSQNSKEINDLIQDMIKNKDKNNKSLFSGSSNITPDNYVSEVMSTWQEKFAYQQIPKALWPSYINITGDSIEFKKITFLWWWSPVKVYKILEDLNWGNLEYWDKVKITVYFENPQWKRFTYLEELKWPYEVLSIDWNTIVQVDNILKNQVSFPKKYRNFIFRLDGVNKTSSISYYAIYKWDSYVKIKVWDWNKDKFWDIKVFLENGCIKWYDYFKGASSSIPMNFNYEFINLWDKLKEKFSNLNSQKALKDVVDKINQATENAKNGDISTISSLFNEYVGDLEENNPWSDWNLNMDFSLSIWPNIANFKAKIMSLLNGFCNGFSIWKSDCWWIPIPCNFAFFAPWIINVCGCPVGIDPWIPIFWFPWTSSVITPAGCVGPIPTAYFQGFVGLDSPITMAAPMICMPWILPTMIRIYLSPTLTAGLWVAICFGPYLAWMLAPPPPFWAIMWNCIVFAGDLPFPGWCDKSKASDADDELDSWMNDLDNWDCDQLPFEHGIYPTSPLNIPSASNFFAASINPAFSFNGLNWLITFNMNAHKISSLADAEVLLQWWVPFTLKIRTWTFKWIISCIIKKWLNKQIQFIISQLTRMTIYVNYPDIDGLIDDFKNLDLSGKFSSFIDNVKKGFDTKKIKEAFDIDIWTDKKNLPLKEKIKAYFPSKEWLKELSKQLSNPFKELKALLNQIPLVKVQEKSVVLNVPWIWKDEIDKQIAYLETWLERNKEIIKKWQEFYSSAAGECEKLYPNNPNKQKECKWLYANALKVNSFVNSIQKNIEILEQYRNLPLQLYQYVHLVDRYFKQVLCILNKYIDMIIWWLSRNSLIFEKWVDAIITIINVIKTWQILIDVSVNWKTSCGKCRADNWDLYDCILGLLCSLINLPVLPIPPFRLPDIFIDFSHINLWLNVVLPNIKINPIPIWMFTLPDLPYPSLSIKLPSLPLLPAPPKLPELPDLPTLPTLELPNLPPPPMIPELLPAIRAVLEIFSIISFFRCIIKHWIWLVAEWNVKTRIEQLTARKNRLFPFDFLNIDFPVLPFVWFDVKVDAYINFNISFDMIYQIVKWLVDPINNITSSATENMLEFNMKWNQKTSELQFDNLNIEIDPGAYLPQDKIEAKFTKAFIYDQLTYLLSQRNKEYLKSLPSYIYDDAQKVIDSILTKPSVKSNYKWLEKVRNEFTKLIEEYRQNLENVKKEIDNIWDKKIPSYKFVKHQESEKNAVFFVNLFKVPNDIKETINYDIKKAYLQMYGKVLNKFAQKLPLYKAEKPENYVIYEQIEKPIKDSLKMINNALWTDYKFSSAPANSSSMLIDPSQLIRWLYMEWDDGTYYNVLADKNKAKKTRQSNNYIIADINNDGTSDMIWWDKYNVYIKYSNDKPEDNWVNYTQKYIYDNVVSSFEDIVDRNGYVELGNSKFKIWSSKISVNDLVSKWNTADQISLGWSIDKTVNSYVILYSSRVDILNDLEKQFNYSDDFTYEWKNYKTYGVVIYNSKLWKVDENSVSSIQINWHKVKWLTYIPVDKLEDKETILAVLKRNQLYLKDKWKYFRVLKANLNLESKQLNILSSYSNQDVWAEQLIGDDIAPEVKITLERQGDETTEGTHFVAYINTHYTLRWTWTDNVALKKSIITDKDYNLITEEDFVELFESVPWKKIFHFIWIDWNGNRQDVRVVVNFKVPDIKIVKLDPNKWTVIAKIWKDMDKTAIKFYVKKKWEYVSLKTVDWKQIFTGGKWDIIFTGQIFNLNKTLTLYNKSWKEIGLVDLEKGIIHVDPPYKVYGVSEDWLLYTNVYEKKDEKYEKIFEIYIPSKELVSPPEMLNTSNFELKELSWANLGEFSDSYCIFDKLWKSCAIYIAKDTGKIYIDSGYNFVAKYNKSSETWVITYEFYNVLWIRDDLFTDGNKVFKVKVRNEDLLKLDK